MDIRYGTRLGSDGLRFSRIPRHVGFIPDGNRRWADARGAPRREGYPAGILPGLAFLGLCRELGIEEVSVYGFTKENVRRPSDQVHAFREACVEFGLKAVEAGAALHVIGDVNSTLFPDELRPYASKRSPGGILFNLLVNYGWRWDLVEGMKSNKRDIPRSFSAALASGQASRVDLVVRWGGRRRLSGFLPVQCAYAEYTSWTRFGPICRRTSLLRHCDGTKSRTSRSAGDLLIPVGLRNARHGKGS